MLSASTILREIEQNCITIKPFDPARLGINSYDVCIARNIIEVHGTLDMKLPLDPNAMTRRVMDDDGYVLHPERYYLAVTREWTHSDKYVVKIDGRSTVARYGVTVHQTAGFGDLGFAGHWTLEITVARPIRIYPNSRIAQLSFETCSGWYDKETKDRLYKGRYSNEFEADPWPSVPRPGNI